MKPKRGEIIVGFIPAFIIIAIIFTSGVAGFLYTKELEKSTYFLELRAENDHQYANLKQQSRLKKETADWTTYRNEKYGFEVKYPNNWSRDASIGNQISSVSFIDPENSAETIAIEITKENIDGGISIREWIDMQIWPFPGRPNDQFDDFGDVGGAFAVQDKTTGTVFFLRDAYIFSVKNGVEFERKTVSRDVFDQILSTFKFIK